MLNAPNRPEIWSALAEHFLDTETSQDIPTSALLLCQARLSIEEAGRVWRYEVTPAVWFNLWDIAGEWAGWDAGWLSDRVKSKRGRWPNTPGPLAYLVYRLRVHCADQVWREIERCMQAYLAVPVEARTALHTDLHWLAAHFFDMATGAEKRPPGDRDRIGKVYTEVFAPVFCAHYGTGTHEGEAPGARDKRVREALFG